MSASQPKPKYFAVSASADSKTRIGSHFYPLVDSVFVERTTKDTPKDAIRFTRLTLEEAFPELEQSEIDRARKAIFARHKKLHPEAVEEQAKEKQSQKEGKTAKRKAPEPEKIKTTKQRKTVTKSETEEVKPLSNYQQFNLLISTLTSETQQKHEQNPKTIVWKPKGADKNARWNHLKKLIEQDPKFASEKKMKSFISTWKKEDVAQLKVQNV